MSITAGIGGFRPFSATGSVYARPWTGTGKGSVGGGGKGSVHHGSGKGSVSHGSGKGSVKPKGK